MEIIFSAELLEHKVKIKKSKTKKPAPKTPKKKPPTKLLKFSMFFEEANVPYVELYTLGLGRDTLRYLPTRKNDPLHSQLDLHTVFNIRRLTDNYKKVIWYEAKSVMDKCKPSIFMVLFDLLWVGTDQLAEFKNPVEKRVQTSEKLSKPILANFNVRA